MKIGKLLGTITALIFILFAVLFFLAAFSPKNQSSPTGSFITGFILLAIGFGGLWFLNKSAKASSTVSQNVTLNVDLPADVNVERFKCQDCGSQLTMDNVKMIAGAPMVNCPYCDAAYQLTEQPKW